MRQAGLVMLILLVCGTVWAAPQQPELTATQRARYHQLNRQIRCMICQSRSIADSDAPLAADMRNIVARQIAAGRSDSQIKHYLVNRYGEYILYKPPFKPSTWLLWLGPAILLLIAIFVVFVLWRKTRRRQQPCPPDATAIDRLLKDEQR